MSWQVSCLTKEGTWDLSQIVESRTGTRIQVFCYLPWLSLVAHTDKRDDKEFWPASATPDSEEVTEPQRAQSWLGQVQDGLLGRADSEASKQPDEWKESHRSGGWHVFIISRCRGSHGGHSEPWRSVWL